jgi:hypothetical protein
MRIAIFVAVVAAHIALVWYFLTLWHLAAAEGDAELAMTLVLLAPPALAPEPAEISEPREPANSRSPNSWQGPLLYSSAQGSLRRETQPTTTAPRSTPPQSAALQSAAPQNPTPRGAVAGAPPRPDWREAAEAVAQADAQHIVESEDRAARQAGALTAMIKPLPGPYVPGPSFHWDPNPRHHWQRAQGGGWIMPLNDHCDIGFFIMLWIGCTVGELPPARGDLFKNMHPPVKFGDWDWRVDDP